MDYQKRLEGLDTAVLTFRLCLFIDVVYHFPPTIQLAMALPLPEGLIKTMHTSARPHFILIHSNYRLTPPWALGVIQLWFRVHPIICLFQNQAVVHTSVINFSIAMA